MKKVIFISDMHLDEQHPEMAEQFILFLKNCDKSVDAVYILGDMFEVWIGDDYLNAFNQKIISALANATKKGLAIFIMYGNRDFLMRDAFFSATGCKLIDDPTIASLFGERVLLMHGDTLCIHDLKYMKARKLARNRLLQCIFLRLPLFLRKKFANNMRAKSNMHTQSADREIMDVANEEVVRMMQQHQVNYLIHGHTHKRGFHKIDLSGNQGERIVLGSWHSRGNALIWHEDGKKELLDLPHYDANGL